MQSLGMVSGRRLMVLSPHLDDGVLSCGALIADSSWRGIDVVVVTVFNGRPAGPISPAAAAFHAQCGLVDKPAMAVREAEDDRALAEVGARSERLLLPEALYRMAGDGAPLYGSSHSLFEEPPVDEHELVAVIAQRFGDAAAAMEPDLVVAPLAIGGHVDHRLVLRAARWLDYRVLHYEDVPYLLFDRCRNWGDSVSVRCAHVHHATQGAWRAKLDGIECYASQQGVLWPDRDSWHDDLTEYASAVGGGRPAERYWTLDGD
jgi:LmbE family N-acetylglucosaminyl deacetylase